MASLSNELVTFQADVVKALGHPLRIEIVGYLKQKERSVSDIIEHFGVDPSNVSRHLAILKRAGILNANKRGLNVYYEVAMSCVPDFLNCIGQSIRKRFER
ncbi:MAG TPA: metalloregulator ArsR/SmtB family transcription factor [Phycisphaerae bacterium]|nr:winged helix-turn-helix transcriptional regulator [Phycisphaerae bacterium]HOI55768.1 metalloregulator ArsR/SmtB family transcription factor [Phycisphaerae bacterium]